MIALAIRFSSSGCPGSYRTGDSCCDLGKNLNFQLVN